MGIKERIREYCDAKNISIRQFEIQSKMSNGYVSSMRKGLGVEKLENVLNAFPDINREWLLFGEGSMTKIGQHPVIASHVFQLQTDHATGAQRIPLFDITGTCGLMSIFDDASVVPSDYLSVPDLPAVDGAIYVRGDSMSPVIKSGDIIIFKKVELDDTSILWGQIYLLSFAIQGDSYTVVKYVKQSDRPGYIRLISANEFYDPQEIRAESITCMAIVKASITFHTIG